MTVNSMNVVTPTSASVMPTRGEHGRIVGPGRWISSPTGGTLGIERAHET